MFSKINGMCLNGICAHLITTEIDLSDGLPSFGMSGALGPEVRESQERVRTALKNSGFRFPPKKVTLNLSPADIRKSGTGFDLPIAVGMLAAYGVIDADIFSEAVFIGELSLDGRVMPVKGILPMVMGAVDNGIKTCYLSKDNTDEGRMVQGIDIVGISDLKEFVSMINEGIITCEVPFQYSSDESYPVDYSEVQGQFLMRRATEVAVAGKHNILYLGAAGTGKTMIAERIPTILPSCTMKEKLEISKIYSVCGLLPADHPFMDKRPFRNPHHTSTVQALTGGGVIPVPGEMSLASGGVLFLDELAEFSKKAIETLRQPLESKKIVISRVSGRYEFPADFILVGASNLCPCGQFPNRDKCHCTEAQIRAYLSKISKPIRDRIDICVEAETVSYDNLSHAVKQEDSASIRKRVEHVRAVQAERFKDDGILFNSEMTGEMIHRYCHLSRSDEKFFKEIYQDKNLSPRVYNKILKVARTIADLDGADDIRHTHLYEAVGYRSLEGVYWN